MIALGRGLGLVLTFGLVTGSAGVFAWTDDPASQPVRLAQVPKKKTPSKPKKAEGEPKPKDAASTDSASAPAGDDSAPKFTRDVAAVLVQNCVNCHNDKAGARRNNFDLSTFAKLMKGGDTGPVIEPGKPEESLLIKRVKGAEGLRKMPPGQNTLAPETIARIEAWIKTGGRLDAGANPSALLASIAVSPERVRREALAKLSPGELEKTLADKAAERYKQANVKTPPEATPGSTVTVFSNLSKSRATALVKTLDGQVRTLRGLLTRPGAAPVLGTKISVYVFNDVKTFTEFVRAVEKRELEQGDEASAKLDDETPYLAAADPAGGLEIAAPKKKGSRSKKSDILGPERTLVGLLAERMGTAAANQAGKPPVMLAMGLGAYLGSQVEGSSPYYQKLRAVAYDQCRLGWESKANEALGGEADAQKLRAIGLSLVEWMAANYGPIFPNFLRGMLDGQAKLDDVIKACWDTDRKQFLNTWGGWVMARYGRGR